MFDNVGRTKDDEAVLRSLIALGLVGFVIGSVWAVLVVVGILFAVQEVTGIDLGTNDMVEILMEDADDLEAPPPPPPPPPPPAAAETPEEEDPDDTPDPDEMVEEVAQLEEKIEQKQVTAKRPAGETGGVEGGVEGGVVGGVIGGVVGGELGGQLGGVRAFHHSEVKVKRRVQPVYPDVAKSMNLGDVSCRVRVFIDETGKPYDVKFDACPKVFHTSASQAIYGWRYYPAKDEAGNKIKATFRLNIKYKLN